MQTLIKGKRKFNPYKTADNTLRALPWVALAALAVWSWWYTLANGLFMQPTPGPVGLIAVFFVIVSGAIGLVYLIYNTSRALGNLSGWLRRKAREHDRVED